MATREERIINKMKLHNLTRGQAEDLVDDLENFERRWTELVEARASDKQKNL